MKEIYKQYMYSYPHKTAYESVEKSAVVQAFGRLAGKTSLYLHIPFCQAKCGYCNLFSVAGNQKLIENYIEATECQCAQISRAVNKENIEFTSLILGGGTPSVFTPTQLERLLLAIETNFLVSPKNIRAEIEVAPNQASDEMLSYLKNVGFKRVSMGVQSFVKDELSLISRIHSPEVCKAALSKMKAMNFECVNSDLIYGLPNQTEESLGYSIETMLRYNLDEIFIYPLYVKKHTPLYGKLSLDEARMVELYKFAREKLLDVGYSQISMRRFVKTKSTNEADPCGFEQGIALGCGGRSYLGDLHICHPYQISPNDCHLSLQNFCKNTDFFTGLSGYYLDEDEYKRRYVIKNILHTTGILKRNYYEHFRSDLFENFPVLQALIEEKFCKNTEDRLYLTEEGIMLSDHIGPMFISEKAKIASANYYKKYQQKENVK